MHDLNFGMALEFAKDGRRIGRKAWEGEFIWVAEMRGIANPFFVRSGEVAFVWSPTHEDLLAEDWGVVDG